MSMDTLVSVLKSVPTRTLAMIGLILSCWLVYCVYAGEIRTMRDAVIAQQATDDKLAGIVEGMDERLKWLERQKMEAAEHAPPVQPPLQPSYPRPTP